MWSVTTPVLFAQNKKGDKKKDKKKDETPVLAIGENSNNDPQLNAEAEASFIDGMKYYALEDYLRALEAFQKALALSSGKQSGIHYKIGQTYLQLNNLPQAEFYTKNAIENEKDNAYYYVLLAKIHELQLKYNEAAKDYENLIDNVKKSYPYYYDLANLYIRQKQYDKAQQAYDKLEKEVGITEMVSLQKQKIYMQLNQPEKALSEARRLQEYAPLEPKYAVNLAEMLITVGKPDEAKILIDKALKEGITEPRLQLLMAKLERDKGNTDLALTHLRKAFVEPELDANDKMDILTTYMQGNELKARPQEFADLAEIITQVHPEKAKAHLVYADILLLKGDKLKARDSYLKAVSLENTKSEVWQRILGLDSEANQMENLVKHATQAVESFPNVALFWYYQGIGYIGMRKYQDAVNALEEAKRMAFNNPKLLEDVNFRLGDAYNGTKQYADSDASYEAVLKNSPNHALTLNNYSYFLALRKQKLEYAKNLAEKLVNNHPDDANFLDTYGWVLYVAKDYQKAKKQLERAAQLSSSGTVQEHLGDVLFQLGEKERAVEQWQKAKKQGGTSAQIDQKIAERKLIE
jgi:tetratricopeptide (TPR) repeat protein